MTVPYSFANATVSIPLSQLDANFNTPITLGNTAIQLGNTVTTLNNMTLANVTISSGNVTITNVSVTTANVTTLNATTVIATTANVTTANITTGNVTNMSSGNVAITGGSINGTTLGATTASTANVTTLTTSSTVTINGGTVNGVAYLNGSKVLTTGSALTFDGTNLTVANGDVTIATNGKKLYVNYIVNNSGTDLNINGATNQIFSIAGSEQMRLTSTGLGIGTSSPAYKLDVVGGSISASNAGNNPQLRAVDGTVIAKLQSLSVGYTGGWVGTESNHNFQLVTNNSAKATLDSSGNLGLGATPSAWGSNAKALEIGSGASTSLSFNFSETNLSTNVYRINTGASLYKATGIAMLYTQSSGGHAWSIAPSGTAGDTISFTQAMTLDASGNLGLGTTSPASNGSTFATLSLNGSNGGALHFMNAGTTVMQLYNDANAFFLNAASGKQTIFQTASTERARITSGGELMVGTTTSVSNGVLSVTKTGEIDLAGFWNQSSAGNGTALFVKRTNTGNLLYFVHSTSNTYVGQISTNGTTVSYTSASDARLKKNIVEATEAGSEIDALKVRAFDWKADNSHVKYGFIAQELIEVVPEAVSKSENPDGMMGVDYSKLVPMLVKEIQSLRTRLAAAGL
jgi:hypothetical protein